MLMHTSEISENVIGFFSTLHLIDAIEIMTIVINKVSNHLRQIFKNPIIQQTSNHRSKIVYTLTTALRLIALKGDRPRMPETS